MDGFTIKCNECGREQVLKSGQYFNPSNEVANIYLYVDHYDLAITISCQCDNEIESKGYHNA